MPAIRSSTTTSAYATAPPSGIGIAAADLDRVIREIYGRGNFQAFSAGSHPGTAVHPLALHRAIGGMQC